jgi:hypothetical protein
MRNNNVAVGMNGKTFLYYWLPSKIAAKTRTAGIPKGL